MLKEWRDAVSKFKGAIDKKIVIKDINSRNAAVVHQGKTAGR